DLLFESKNDEHIKKNTSRKGKKMQQKYNILNISILPPPHTIFCFSVAIRKYRIKQLKDPP
ncbi:MAG: hypothetical protein KBE40_08495, partial [Bacteroidales bacterium]|nr:hypothetical protein [Bacteroidales bacterium]